MLCFRLPCHLGHSLCYLQTLLFGFIFNLVCSCSDPVPQCSDEKIQLGMLVFLFKERWWQTILRMIKESGAHLKEMKNKKNSVRVVVLENRSWVWLRSVWWNWLHIYPALTRSWPWELGILFNIHYAIGSSESINLIKERMSPNLTKITPVGGCWLMGTEVRVWPVACPDLYIHYLLLFQNWNESCVVINLICLCFKRIVHLKMKICWKWTQLLVIQDEFVSSLNVLWSEKLCVCKTQIIH